MSLPQKDNTSPVYLIVGGIVGAFFGWAIGGLTKQPAVGLGIFGAAMFWAIYKTLEDAKNNSDNFAHAIERERIYREREANTPDKVAFREGMARIAAATSRLYSDYEEFKPKLAAFNQDYSVWVREKHDYGHKKRAYDDALAQRDSDTKEALRSFFELFREVDTKARMLAGISDPDKINLLFREALKSLSEPQTDFRLLHLIRTSEHPDLQVFRSNALLARNLDLFATPPISALRRPELRAEPMGPERQGYDVEFTHGRHWETRAWPYLNAKTNIYEYPQLKHPDRILEERRSAIQGAFGPR